MSVVASRSGWKVADAVRQMANRLPEIRLEAIRHFALCRSDAVAHLALLKGAVNDADQSVRLAAARTICSLGETTMPAMARMLSHPDKYVRRQAVWGLGKLGERALPLLPDLCKSLNDADTRVATGAAMTIGGMGAEAAEAIPALAKSMRGSNVVLCRIAAKALSMIGMPALPQLRADLRHYDLFVRGEAAMAVGWMGPAAAETVPDLKELLSIPSVHEAGSKDTPTSPENAARAAAAAALGKLGDAAKSVVELLQRTRFDACPMVSQASEQSLRMLGVTV
jgi:HEAT repeat protein